MVQRFLKWLQMLKRLNWFKNQYKQFKTVEKAENSCKPLKARHIPRETGRHKNIFKKHAMAQPTQDLHTLRLRD